MMKIAELASVSTGYHFRGSINPKTNGQYAVIQAKDVSDSLEFDPEKLARVDLESDLERYILRSGDVLFLSRGQKPWAITLSDLIQPTIAPSSFYIVRPQTTKIKPEYLTWYLNHDTTQAALRTMTTGSNIPFLSRAEFEKLPILLPPLATQQQIVELIALGDEEQRLLQELAHNRKRLVEAVCMSIAGRDLKN
jgi:restriction endonuclease S subunit